MNDSILLEEEFISRLNISKKTLHDWINAKLIEPEGKTDEDVHFFLQAHTDEAQQIKKLQELGYKLEDIQKIVKKIGLPQKGDKRDGKKSEEKFLTVGSLANNIGVSPRTIKHWEDKGIIEPDMRSNGGFRLYNDSYIYLCKLIQDLQLFGYTLDEIKIVSDYFRDFWEIQNNPSIFSQGETDAKLNEMLYSIEGLFDKIKPLKEGIERWEDLLKKKKKEIAGLVKENKKRE